MNFHSQKDLSQCQAQWMEFLSQYDARIVYIKGEDNNVANTLSCLPVSDSTSADASARHPYNFCEDDNTLCAVASLSVPSPQGNWGTAKSLSACNVSLNSVNAMLEIMADRAFLNAVKVGYTDDADTRCTGMTVKVRNMQTRIKRVGKTLNT
ncbi:uncharacterized protein LACBIDRAFT_313293 [Laccaria bicolor S238N-H82]|uniref:Predicted protein n=1 Tax=Laccaria bicolor (strain S238N-H82 / ATCC MYA-4686) TaxID=486041 RepID=B0DY02_LACBS|nr:uncharacterized protein LACBIDRAFT_313293 [Laccaria bicolor S238N-H82]EDR00599.1 predicted protein [Laccaria bicolor S238N-H82]|eukprot:XP_001888826.1 predicted protein [Laccaria bicolor S238N-H82]